MRARPRSAAARDRRRAPARSASGAPAAAAARPRAAAGRRARRRRAPPPGARTRSRAPRRKPATRAPSGSSTTQHGDGSRCVPIKFEALSPLQCPRAGRCQTDAIVSVTCASPAPGPRIVVCKDTADASDRAAHSPSGVRKHSVLDRRQDQRRSCGAPRSRRGRRGARRVTSERGSIVVNPSRGTLRIVDLPWQVDRLTRILRQIDTKPGCGFGWRPTRDEMRRDETRRKETRRGRLSCPSGNNQRCGTP